MKFSASSAAGTVEILANDDYAGVPHKFSSNAAAGDIVDGKGVCLYDVTVADNPNGTVIYRGVIDVSKIEESQLPKQAQQAALPMVKWLKPDGTFYTASV